MNMFPDAQHYVQQVIAQAEATDNQQGMLDALVEAYRRQLDGKRALVILDDPPEPVDIMRLLPPAGSAAIVIGRPGHAGMRRDLSRYQWLNLRPLTEEQAIMLMKERWTTAFDPALAAAFARLCGYVPLALKVISMTAQREVSERGSAAARRLFERMDAERRKRPGGGWTLFRLLVPVSKDGYDQQSLEEVLRLSYELLSPEAQRLFRALAVMDNRPFTRAMALAVCGEGNDQDSEAAFDEILQRGLLARRSATLFTM